MDNTGGRGPPPPPRSRTSSTSSLRSPSGATNQQQAPATPPRGSGASPATAAGIVYAGSHTPSRQLSTGSLVGVPFQGISPDQLVGSVGSTGRVRCPSIASIDQLSSSSRSSSIPPTPAPTPNPLLHVSHHMVHEQLVAGIKQLNADEGYIDSTSFPATPAPSPFSPSPAQVSQFSPDQVAEGIQRLREEATRDERSGSILTSASGLAAGRFATATGINVGHIGSGISSFGGMAIGGHVFGGSSGTSTGQPPTPSSTPGPPGLAAAAIAHHQLGVIPEHLAESIQRNLRPTDEGLDSTSSPGTPVPTPISPSLSHQMQHQSNVLPEQLVAGIHRLKESEGMSSGGSSALPSTPAPTPYSHHPGGVRPEDLAAGISRLSVIEEGDVQQQQIIAINVSAHESTCNPEDSTSAMPNLSQYFKASTGTNHQLSDNKKISSAKDSALHSGGEQFFDQILSQPHGPLKLDPNQQIDSSVLHSCRESRVDLSSLKEGTDLPVHVSEDKNLGNKTNDKEACLDVIEQEFDDARSLQRRTSQDQVKQQNRSRNESTKTEDEEPKLFTFFAESPNGSKDILPRDENVSQTETLREDKDPFDTIVMSQVAQKPSPPTSLQTSNISTEQPATSKYSTPVAPTPTTASTLGTFPVVTTSVSGVAAAGTLSYSTYSHSIPASATPLLQQAVPRFDPAQPIRSPLPQQNYRITPTALPATSSSSQDASRRNELQDEPSQNWNRSESAWIPCQSTSQILTTLIPGAPPESSVLTMPGVHAREDLHDPIKSLVARYRGEAEAAKRQVLTADVVSQDHAGLTQLIECGCYRAAVNLTTRLLTSHGQGPGQNESLTRHTPASLKVWYVRLFLLVQLKQFSTVEVEAEVFGDLDKPDLYYEYYSRIEPHNSQDLDVNKVGSMVPFGFRLLLAELPQYLGKHHEAIDRLHQLLATVDKILKNLKNNRLENAQIPGPNENNDNTASIQLWNKRKQKVLYTISNCALLQKDFELSIMTLERLYEIVEAFEEKTRIKSSIGRIFLQLGDVTMASNCFDIAKQLRTQNQPSENETDNNEQKVAELVDDALLSMSTNNFLEALNILEQADKNSPGNPLVINNKSVCLLYLGRLKEALSTLESELTSNPRNILREAHVLNLATLYELESSYAGQKKQALLDLMSQYAGDGANTACLKF